MTQSNESEVLRVYCAGPLFNRAEREEMSAIADLLCDAGYAVYLPHRDGMEFRHILHVLTVRGWEAQIAAEFLHEAIFALDVYQLAIECDAMVWNLNGRTPDEGAVSEAAMNWTLGKPLVAYKDDVRSLIAGRVNPLLVGMVDFKTLDCIDEIPQALSEAIIQHQSASTPFESMPIKLREAIEAGRRLWIVLSEQHAQCNNDKIADIVEELFAPRANSKDGELQHE